MGRTTRPPLCNILLAFAFAGCGPAVDSEDIKTSGLYARYVVWSHSDHITIDATLQVGSGMSNQVRLSPGDSLTATVASTELPMVEEPCGGKCIPGIFYSYTANSPVIAGNTPVRVSLWRPDEFADAPNSQVLLPSPHLITEPAAGTPSYDRPLSRSQGKLTVRWAPVEASDRVQVRFSADCQEGTLLTKEGYGLDSIVLDPSRVEAKASDGSCYLSVWVTLERQGAVDPAFGEGGEFIARREQHLYLASVP